MMTQAEMNLLVPQRLAQIEGEYGVKALCAVESGSRAWGFASPDSDFDVRFIYIRPREDYLRLHGHRDVIETPIDDTWDVSGWDLQKALRLLYNSNPTLFEWQDSAIRYLDTGFEARFAPMLAEYFQKKAMMYHYFHMARNNIRAYLRRESVKPKKYFYALRPVLACQWIREHDSPPPMLYDTLAEAELPPALGDVNARLLEMKRELPEGATIKPIREIDAFLDESLEALEGYMHALPDYKPRDWEPLEDFFLAELERNWPAGKPGARVEREDGL